MRWYEGRGIAAGLLVILLVLPTAGDEPERAKAPLTADQAKKIQQAWAQHLAKPVEVKNSLGMPFALIPPGEFSMGSPPTEEWHREDEVLHRVTLTKPFYMGTTEVSQKQWKAVMGTEPSFCVGDDLPVDSVTWDQAVEFCRKLSQQEGVTYDLPTEAQWEFCCRAGTTTPFSMGATVNTDQANYDGRKTYAGGRQGVFRDGTSQVGSLKPNAWGLYDMHGNVWEWCRDWYSEYPTESVTDPTGPASGERRILRGGCWVNFPAVCRSANRGKDGPTSWNFHLGLRVVQILK